MSIQTQDSSVIHAGDGVSIDFSVPYPFIEKEHLFVYEGTGKMGEVDRLLTLGADYSVTGVADPKDVGFAKGTVKLATPLETGMKLAIMRVVPLTQTVKYPEAGTFPARTHEMGLDKLTMIVQQLVEVFSRTPYGQPTGGASGEMIIQEMNRWYEETMANAASAATDAGRAETAAGRAEAAKTQAKADADRAAALVDTASLASSVYNVRKAWVVPEDIPAGGILEMPGVYFPTRDVLWLSYKGTVCTPRLAGVAVAGEYQYAEIGDDPNQAGNSVTVYFDVSAGDVFDMWVVASAAGRNVEELEQLVLLARDAADDAKTAATDATDAALQAEAAARALPDIGTAEAGQVPIVRIVDGEKTVVYGTPPGSGVSRARIIPPDDIAAGGTLDVPAYTVGTGKLTIYYKGVLCDPGTGAADGFYAEIGAAGAISSTVTVFDAIPAGTEITAIAAS